MSRLFADSYSKYFPFLLSIAPSFAHPPAYPHPVLVKWAMMPVVMKTFSLYFNLL